MRLIFPDTALILIAYLSEFRSRRACHADRVTALHMWTARSELMSTPNIAKDIPRLRKYV